MNLPTIIDEARLSGNDDEPIFRMKATKDQIIQHAKENCDNKHSKIQTYDVVRDEFAELSIYQLSGLHYDDYEFYLYPTMPYAIHILI